MAQDRTPASSPLRQVYDAVVGGLGNRLSDFTASEGFAEATEVVLAAQTRIQREIERRSRRILHFWNLPAGSDVTVLRREIGELERQVRDLTKRLEDAGHVDAPDASGSTRDEGRPRSRSRPREEGP